MNTQLNSLARMHDGQNLSPCGYTVQFQMQAATLVLSMTIEYKREV